MNATCFPTCEICRVSDSLGRLGWHGFFYFSNKSTHATHTDLDDAHS